MSINGERDQDIDRKSDNTGRSKSSLARPGGEKTLLSIASKKSIHSGMGTPKPRKLDKESRRASLPRLD